MQHAGALHGAMTVTALLLALGSCVFAPAAREAGLAGSSRDGGLAAPGGARVAGAGKLGPDGGPGPAGGLGPNGGPVGDAYQQARWRARQQVEELAQQQPQRTQPAVADDPTGLAAQLETAQRVLRDDAAGPAVWAAAGHLQQVAIRRLVDRPEWQQPVRAAIADELVGFIDHDLAAGRALARMHPTPDFAPGEWPPPPPWHIVEPAPLGELRDAYEASAAQAGIHWSYLAAINLIETKMGRIHGVSSAGARGPMQFLPSTWELVGAGSIHDERDAIMAAGRLLAQNGAPGDMDAALMAYNPDTRYVTAVQQYAAAIRAEPDTLRGYYYWQVYIPGPDGPRLLPIGFDGR
ncbi:MAG: lytic transglycosylase [Actinobacteria bacterium QS_5_72_10]|nr:MAG: lytic transglycosylase [Actinobacteria bacterium QS_5_72_10]